MPNKKKPTQEISESYGLLKENDRSFDRRYWQSLGSKAIFDAAYDMIKDYLLLREKNADRPQFQRTIESFGKKFL
jgi:hypothetical protein